MPYRFVCARASLFSDHAKFDHLSKSNFLFRKFNIYGVHVAGLTLSAASCGHDITTVCSNQERVLDNAASATSPNSSFDDHDVMQRIAESSHLASAQDNDVSLDDDCLNQLANSSALTHSDVLQQFKSNSLPMYFSKRCKLCNKPQTNKAHLPKYLHVPNASLYCTCATHAHQVASRAHPPNRNSHAVKPPPDVSIEEPVNKSSYQRDKVDPLEYKHKKQVSASSSCKF